MISSKKVTVLRYTQTGRDSMNADIYEWIPEDTPVQVVVTPGKVQELDSNRPEGVVVAFTLHFQKSYTQSLRGCKVLLDGREYKVIGDPQPYMPENTPGLYNRPVEVEAVDG